MSGSNGSTGRAGSDWTAPEVEACVQAYLDMLAMEVTGRPYSKIEFNRRVQQETGRSKGSVEFKFQNVSAVLDQMGRRWIQGYKPAKHAQAGPIRDVLDRLLPAFEQALAAPQALPRSTPVATTPGRASLKPLTRDAVIRAVEEFDVIGRDDFLKTYGYGEADGYWIIYDQGRYDRYDSKAIVGVAFKFIEGIERPLLPSEFSGGRATVLPALQRLGFEVEVNAQAAPGMRRPASMAPQDADEEPFDPTNAKDAREKVLREIRARRGQKQFRDALIEAYEGRCAVTGCDVLDVLEAAHITPYLGPETNHVTKSPLILPNSVEASRLVEEVMEFNAFARTFSVTYGPDEDARDIGPQFQRIFTENLGLHGRWYAAGGGYQRLPSSLRHGSQGDLLGDYSRRTLRIDGEPCVELDVRASYLTIIHGIAGVPLPAGGDPYAVIQGVPREVVKAWVASRIGQGRAPSSWNRDAVEDLRADHGIDLARFRVGDVGQGIRDAMPFLGRGLPALLGVADQPRLCSHVLMGIEARALTRAMMALKEQGMLGLPLHDALIVQERHAEAAREALEAGYLAEAGITPVVRVKRGVEGS